MPSRAKVVRMQYRAAVEIMRRNRWIFIALALMTIAVYAPSLGNEFINHDDNLLIYENSLVHVFNVRTIVTVFSSYDPELYVPLTMLTFQIERLLFGFHPFFFHLTNLLLHIGSGLLIFGIVRCLARRRSDEQSALWIAVFASTVFLIHPINVEAVAWASARKDVLSGFFFFLSLMMYLLYRRKNGELQIASNETKISPFVLRHSSLFFFLLALLSKVSVIMLPLILIIVDLYEGRKDYARLLVEKIPFFALSILFGGIALGGKSGQLAGLTGLEHLALSVKGSAFYIFKLLLPTSLTLLHPEHYPIDLRDPTFLVSGALVISLIILAILSFQRKRIAFFGIIFYLVMLLPNFATFWKTGFVYFASERYAYTALVGILFLLGCGIVPFALRTGLYRKVAALLGLIILLILSMITIRQSLTWKTSERVQRQVLLFYPDSTHALGNLGTTLYEEGKPEEAIAMYDRALAIDTHLPQIHANRGLILLKLGRIDEALQAYQNGIDHPPLHRPILEHDLLPYVFLADYLDNQNRKNEAFQVWTKAYEKGPEFFLANYALGVKRQERGDMEEALEHFRRAAKAAHRDPDTHYRLAAVAAGLGYIEEAIEALERVLWLDPAYANARAHLENLRKIGRESGAAPAR